MKEEQLEKIIDHLKLIFYSLCFIAGILMANFLN